MTRRPRARILAAVVVIGAPTGAALATLSGGVSVTHTIATGTLAPATGLTASHPTGTSGQVDLAWTPSASAFVGAHVVESALAGTGPWTTRATLGPAGATFTDATAPYNGERYYRVRATRNAWTSAWQERSSHSLPMIAGADRVSGAGAGTTLTGPWTTGGTQLAAVAAADGVRYQPATWPSAPATMFGAFYLDATHAWASGSATTAHFDGTNWAASNSGVPAANFEQIAFVDASRGWSVGAGGRIIASTNGGTSWVSQTSGTTNNLRDIECLVNGAQVSCWAVGRRGTIVATTNSGVAWTTQTSGVPTNRNIWDVDCVSTTVCYAVADAGIIRKTTDGGTTWVAQTSGTTASLSGLACRDASTCVAVGAGGVMLRTTNGTTWSAVASGTTQNLTSVATPSASVIQVTGLASTVRTSTDGGATWVARTVPAAAYQSVSCLDPSSCLIVSDLGAVLMTSDGGTTWDEKVTRYVEFEPATPTIPSGWPVQTVRATVVYRTTTVPPAGTRMVLLASADDGANWSTFDLPLPTAAATDVTGVVDLTPLGFTPELRATTLRLRLAPVPQGGTLAAQVDLVHVDVN